MKVLMGVEAYGTGFRAVIQLNGRVVYLSGEVFASQYAAFKHAMAKFVAEYYDHL